METFFPYAHSDFFFKVWSKYVKKLGDFAKPQNIDSAVQCLNELITNALHHIPDVITYLSRLRNQSVFNFCAIPQVCSAAVLVVEERWKLQAVVWWW